MSKTSTTTDTPHPAGKRGKISLAYRDAEPPLTGVSKVLLLLMFCIQVDYLFNFAGGKTLLSYKREETFRHDIAPRNSNYGTGPWDFVFVLFYATLILFLRLLITRKPRALASCLGAKSPRRFAEQLFSFIYFSTSTTLGFIITCTRQTWSMNAHELASEVATGSLDGKVKCFYLLQAAFWIQEALAIGFRFEKPREDYMQLIFHHIITLLAIGLSYGGNYTDIGVMILVTHDASDAALSVAKLLHYIDSKFTGLAWLIFLFTWLYTRHYLMIPLIYLSWQLSLEVNSRGFRLIGKTSLFSTCLLVLIQILNLYWLTFILRGFYKLLFSSGTTQDMRSEDEEEDE